MKRREFVKAVGLLAAGAVLAKKIQAAIERHTASVTDPITGLTLEAEWFGTITRVTPTTITLRYGSPNTMDLTGAVAFGGQHPFQPGDLVRFGSRTGWVGT